MAYDYSDPKRASDPHALPNIETFYVSPKDVERRTLQAIETGAVDTGAGWYYWPCFPGCLPDGEPMGPFATEAEALADARAENDGEES